MTAHLKEKTQPNLEQMNKTIEDFRLKPNLESCARTGVQILLTKVLTPLITNMVICQEFICRRIIVEIQVMQQLAFGVILLILQQKKRIVTQSLRKKVQ